MLSQNNMFFRINEKEADWRVEVMWLGDDGISWG